MSAPHLLCSRPHVKTITPQQRFVVASCRGIDTGSRQFAQGDEFPGDAVDLYTLRCLYDQRRIDLLAPDAHASAPGASRPAIDPSELQQYGRKQLYALCQEYGLSTDGSNSDLRQRLAALVV